MKLGVGPVEDAETLDKLAEKRGKMKPSDCWKTPSWFMKHFESHYDPCPSEPVKDGLEIDWVTPAFVNPPYSNPLPWVEKAIEQSKCGVDVVMLLRCDPSTNWYKLLIEANAHIAFFNERLKFNDVSGASNFASMLAYLEARK